RPDGCGGSKYARKKAPGFQLIVAAFIDEYFMPVSFQQRPLLGKDHVFATGIVVVVVSCEYSHFSRTGQSIRRSGEGKESSMEEYLQFVHNAHRPDRRRTPKSV